MKIIGIRTKTEYVMKPDEYRDNTPYWTRRLLTAPIPTHYYKHNQHGVKSPLFCITKIHVVKSPIEFLKAGVLETATAIKNAGCEPA